MKVRVDCRGRTTQLLSVRGYSDVGDLVREEGVSPAEAVDPGKEPSVNMFRVACGLPSAPHEWVFATGTAAIKWWRLQ